MEEEYDDWLIEGVNNGYVEFEHHSLRFTPSKRKNLLGHASEWGACLTDNQMKMIAAIADEDGGSLRMEWGVFMCPVRLYKGDLLLVVDTSGVW